MVRDGAPGRLYLPAVDPGDLKGLQAELAERHVVATMGKTRTRPTVGLTKLGSLGHQHNKLLRSTFLFDVGSSQRRSIGRVRGRDCDLCCIRCHTLVGLASWRCLSSGGSACAHARPGLGTINTRGPGTAAVAGCITLTTGTTCTSATASDNITPVTAVAVAVRARLGCRCRAVHLQKSINALALDDVATIYPDLDAYKIGRASCRERV